MANEAKVLAGIATLVFVVVTIGVSAVYFNAVDKRERMAECIKVTNKTLECKCVFRNCYEAERMLLLKNNFNNQ